jgi:uncharacterized protein (TIGR03435 family)
MMKNVCLAAGLVLISLVPAQTQRPRFEVASIKPNAAGPTSMLWEYRGRRFTARWVTVRGLIATAYGAVEHPLAVQQISGGPDWIESDRFDVVATAPEVPDSPRGSFPAPVLAMLRSLLEERFQLQTHTEIKELPIFALVLSRRDGTLGPNLRRRTVHCIAAQAARPESRNLFDPTLTDRTRCGGRIEPGRMTANGLTMMNVVDALTRYMPGINRVVVDRTGLTGTFDVDLTWRFDPTDSPGMALPTPDVNAPSLFPAIEEQLGLKLESTKGPVENLVVDRVDRPTPD